MNLRLETAIQKIFDLAAEQDLPIDTRLKLVSIANDVMNGHAEYEDQLRELRELLYRNPAFPDDMVGHWDDDYELPDEDDDDDKNNPSSKKF